MKLQNSSSSQPPREPSPLRSALKKPAHNYYPESPRRFYSSESLRERRFEDSEESEEDVMYQRRQNRPDLEYHTVGSYGIQNRSQRSRSVPREDSDDVSAVSHRFYDRSGNHVRAPRDRSHDIHIQREYGRSREPPRDLDFVRDTYQWEEQTRKTTTTEEFYEVVEKGALLELELISLNFISAYLCEKLIKIDRLG